MTGALYIALILTGNLYLLWIFFLAVMNLKRAKEAGLLSRTALVFGMPVVWVGYMLDFTCNMTLMSMLFLEPPQELLVTDRLKRHHQESAGWRLRIALWFEPNLDPYDPSGDHI